MAFKYAACAQKTISRNYSANPPKPSIKLPGSSRSATQPAAPSPPSLAPGARMTVVKHTPSKLFINGFTRRGLTYVYVDRGFDLFLSLASAPCIRNTCSRIHTSITKQCICSTYHSIHNHVLFCFVYMHFNNTYSHLHITHYMFSNTLSYTQTEHHSHAVTCFKRCLCIMHPIRTHIKDVCSYTF